ncbi:MAG: Pr6Pr family membrane protein [Ferruginibacter sp.]
MNKLSAIAGTFIGWLALIGQLYLSIENRTTSLLEAIVRFFSYFTIQSNLLVTICFTVIAFGVNASKEKFFSKPTVQSAIVVYIIIVGLVYNLILRSLWNPQGLQYWLDQLLHTVVPIAFVVYWTVFINKQMIGWKVIPSWLIYPSAYCIYTLIRGAFVGFYPYPFLDVKQLGYSTVLFNIGGLILLFIFFCSLIVLIAQQLVSKKIRHA